MSGSLALNYIKGAATGSYGLVRRIVAFLHSKKRKQTCPICLMVHNLCLGRMLRHISLIL